MEEGATWLYRRLGPRYLAFCHLIYALASVLLIAGGVLVFSRFVELSTPELLILLAVAELGAITALAWAAKWFVGGVARPLRDWIADGKPADRAPELWRLAADLPHRTVVRQALRGVPLVAIPSTVALWLILDLGAADVAICFLSLLVAASYPAVLFTLGLELELRPMLRDLARTVPGAIERPFSGPGLGTKLMFAIPATNVAAGGFVGLSIVALAQGSVGDLGVALGIAVAVALSTALLPTALIVRSVMTPVRELVGATEQVRGGELDLVVPVLSSDELGGLADSFNLMLDGLIERQALRTRAHRLELEAERHAHAREAEAREAVLDERGRIARELHDVVDHAIGLIAVQAGRARLAADDPTDVVSALGAIESSGREALGELRSLLGVLRKGGESTLSPQPGIADLPSLVRQIDDAGTPVELEVRGEPDRLPSALQLSAYRLVQAALGSFLEHGQGAATTVNLSCGAAALTIEIESAAAGPRSAEGAVEAGNWLVAMRERVELLGGEIEAAPLPEGGFRINVGLPITSPGPRRRRSGGQDEEAL